jgi:hypothetical protein
MPWRERSVVPTHRMLVDAFRRIAPSCHDIDVGPSHDARQSPFPAIARLSIYSAFEDPLRVSDGCPNPAPVPISLVSRRDAGRFLHTPFLRIPTYLTSEINEHFT